MALGRAARRFSPSTALLLAIGVLATVLGAASLLRALGYLIRIPNPIDLPQYYLSALIFRLEPAASFYDPAVIAGYAGRLGIPRAAPPNYPPFVVLLFYPLSILPYEAAKRVWLGLNVALVFLFLIWAWRRLPPVRRPMILFIAWFILLLPAVTEILLLGVLEILLAWLMLLVIEFARRGRAASSWISGGLLGLAGAVKLWPILFAGFFFLRRRYTLALSSVAVFLVLTLAPLLLVGPRPFVEYFAKDLPSSGARMAQAAIPINQSIWGVSTRLFLGGTTERARLSGGSVENVHIEPLLSSRPLYWLAIAAFLAALAIVLLRFVTGIPAGHFVLEERAYWACVMSVLTALPFAWNYYALHLIFPVAVLLFDDGLPVRFGLSVGTVCLFLTLVHRFWAWLPLHPLLLAFVFLAEVIAIVALLRASARRLAN